jgi:hypothetical protein
MKTGDKVLVIGEFPATIVTAAEFDTLREVQYEDGERTWMDESLLTLVEQ